MELAKALISCRREFTKEAREAEYLPLTSLAYSTKDGFPEIEAQMQRLLEDADTLSQVVDEWTLFAAAHKSNPALLQSRWYSPQSLLQRLEDLQREPVIFTAADGFDPQQQLYISDDELDKVVRAGPVEYRLDVYAFSPPTKMPRNGSGFCLITTENTAVLPAVTMTSLTPINGCTSPMALSPIHTQR